MKPVIVELIDRLNASDAAMQTAADLYGSSPAVLRKVLEANKKGLTFDTIERIGAGVGKKLVWVDDDRGIPAHLIGDDTP